MWYKQFCTPLIRTVYIYVSKYVGIRGYFSKPSGDRKHESLGSTAIWHWNDEGRATQEQCSGGEKLYLYESVSLCSGAVASFLRYGTASLGRWCCTPKERIAYYTKCPIKVPVCRNVELTYYQMIIRNYKLIITVFSETCAKYSTTHTHTQHIQT
jgi:hypothetical protein